MESQSDYRLIISTTCKTFGVKESKWIRRAISKAGLTYTLECNGLSITRQSDDVFQNMVLEQFKKQNMVGWYHWTQAKDFWEKI